MISNGRMPLREREMTSVRVREREGVREGKVVVNMTLSEGLKPKLYSGEGETRRGEGKSWTIPSKGDKGI